ncbi:MAG: nucleotide exchange factor GrpE [Nanoarchaeota archaeon]|nr:nucleotide exchange factor GrpE [Nanoarchaeota archaeon]
MKQEEKTKKTRVAKKDNEKELQDNLQRLQAEFENYKKRVAKESQEIYSHANENLIKELLGVLDNFELALGKENDQGGFYKGVELIYGNLYSSLEKFGLKRIQARGQAFDPRLHEALLTEESDKEADTVLEELQTGYVLNDKVLRHTKVKVSKPKTSKTSDE